MTPSSTWATAAFRFPPVLDGCASNLLFAYVGPIGYGSCDSSSSNFQPLTFLHEDL